MGRHGTIAGRKAAQDSRRSALFTKYAKTITVAAKEIRNTIQHFVLRSKKQRVSECRMTI